MNLDTLRYGDAYTEETLSARETAFPTERLEQPGEILAKMIHVTEDKGKFGNLASIALYNLYQSYLKVTRGQDAYNKVVGRCLDIMHEEERRLVA